MRTYFWHFRTGLVVAEIFQTVEWAPEFVVIQEDGIADAECPCAKDSTYHVP
jgi:hypothetical protein